ncbi:MAG: hypothetical protein CME32_31230 [Gimesia sp.]|nr:hypothetical protein [Gimesia sp.]
MTGLLVEIGKSIAHQSFRRECTADGMTSHIVRRFSWRNITHFFENGFSLSAQQTLRMLSNQYCFQ